MTLAAGDAVVIIVGDRRLTGTIAIGSPNGRSLIVKLDDGMIGGWPGAVPLFCDDAGRWTTLEGVPVDRVWRLKDGADPEADE